MQQSVIGAVVAPVVPLAGLVVRTTDRAPVEMAQEQCSHRTVADDRHVADGVDRRAEHIAHSIDDASLCVDRPLPARSAQRLKL